MTTTTTITTTSTSTARGSGTSARQQWLRALALADPVELADVVDHALDRLDDNEVSDLRRAETGLALVVGRVSATGEPFGVGEVTLTRCIVEVRSQLGVGYVRGRDGARARRIAIVDALLQTDEHARMMNEVVGPLRSLRSLRLAAEADRVAGTRVEFLTVAREN